jgi:integrase
MAKRRGHGEGAIYQRDSDGKWCASVDLGLVNGKRRRKVIYGETRKEVADKLKALHRDQAVEVNLSVERQTIATLLKRWLEEVVAHRNKIRTYESYERIVTTYLVPHTGPIPLGKLTPQQVQRMVNALAEQGLAPNTVRNIRAVFRRALNQALKWGLVARNVAALVDTPRIEQQEIAPLDDQQARALLAAIRGHRLEALYRLALSLGLRRGEALGLRWEDIDFEAATLRVVQTLQRTLTKGKIMSSTKNKSTVRTSPIPGVLRRASADTKHARTRNDRTPTGRSMGSSSSRYAARHWSRTM